MSQSTTAGLGTRPHDSAEQISVDAEDAADLLNILDDVDCRAILEVTGDESLSASELSDRCDIPLSTTYRKLDLLTDAGLVGEGTRVRRSGKHTSEYCRRIDDITVSVSSDSGFEVTVTRCEPAADAARPLAFAD